MGELRYPEPRSWGVAGLLEGASEVCFTPLHSPKNIGRIGDLLAARFRPLKIDELALRRSLEALVFAAYSRPWVDGLATLPMMVEVGADEEKWCVSVAFRPEASEESVLAALEKHAGLCSDVLFRKDRGARWEIVAVHKFQGATDRQPIIRSIDLDESVQGPLANAYIQLGDLDYHALLTEDLVLDGPKAEVTSGDWIARAGKKVTSAEYATIAGRAGSVDGSVATVEGTSTQAGGVGSWLKKLFKKKAAVPSEGTLSFQVTGTVAEEPQGDGNEAAPVEIVKGLERIQQEGAALAKDVKSDRARKWLEALVADLTGEKTRLQEFLKRSGAVRRQKEAEMLGRERALVEEGRKREDLLRQRQNALDLARDQLTALKSELEQFKSGKGQASDLQAKKQMEYLRAQNEKQRIELEQARQKLAETKNSLSSASRADSSQSRDRLEKVQRQNEDFRRQNAQLISRVNELEKRSGSVGSKVDEMKTKMDQAAALLAEKRKEIEALKKASSDRDIAEIRLKRKIADLESKLQISKASQAGGGSSGSNGGGKAA